MSQETQTTAMPSSGFSQRLWSALIMAPAALAVIYIGGNLFTLAVGLAAVIMLNEWLRLTHAGRPRVVWIAAGLCYVFIPCLLLVKLRYAPHGMPLVFTLFAVVWATDIGGYAFGKMFGGPKLAPRISPGKTWTGLLGALAAASLTAWLAARVIGGEWQAAMAIGGAALAVIAQLGDLGESWVKRRFGAKDSGGLIPGHGGLLDRLDGLLAAIPAVWVVDTMQRTQGILAWLDTP